MADEIDKKILEMALEMHEKKIDEKIKKVNEQHGAGKCIPAKDSECMVSGCGKPAIYCKSHGDLATHGKGECITVKEAEANTLCLIRRVRFLEKQAENSVPKSALEPLMTSIENVLKTWKNENTVKDWRMAQLLVQWNKVGRLVK